MRERERKRKKRGSMNLKWELGPHVTMLFRGFAQDERIQGVTLQVRDIIVHAFSACSNNDDSMMAIT